MAVQDDKEEVSSAESVELDPLLKKQEEDSIKSDHSFERDGRESKDHHGMEHGTNKDYVPLEYNHKLGQFETSKAEEAEQSSPTKLTEDMIVEILGPESYTACGLPFFQRLARPQIYFLTLCFLGLTQGMTRSYTGGTMTTIQRRFGLTTKTVGFISTGDDVLEILFSMHIAFMAGNGHRPRWLALGIFFAAASCVLHMIPHLMFGAGDFAQYAKGNYSVSTNGSTPKIDWHGCGMEEPEDPRCKVDASLIETEQYTIITLQFIGKIGNGFLSILTSTIGVSYLDEAVPKDKFPFIVAISACIRFMGPVSGLSMSSWALTWWVDPTEHDNVTINIKHHKWVGAWWIGYIINTAVLLIPLMGFALLPRQLPSVRKRHIERLTAAAAQGKDSLKKYSEKLRPAREPKFRDMLPAFRRLGRNKLFVTLFLNLVVFWFSIGCYFMFKSKYIENQFRMTASEANKYVAFTGFVSSILGFLGMGSFLSFVKPRIKVIIIMTCTISLILFGCFTAMMFVSCDFGEVHGMDIVLQNDGMQNDGMNTKTSNSLASCMTSCECGREFSPVCVNDHYTYYSPCYAGCTNVTKQGKTKEYSGCACLGELSPGAPESEFVVKEGMCDTGCKDQFFMFIAITLILKIALAANRSINGAIFIRSVTDRDKDLALGLRSWVAGGCFLVTPIAIGALIDYACELWDVKCGKEGFCILYNINLYRNIIFGIPAGGMLLAFFTELALLRWHEDIDFYGEKEKEDLGINKKKKSFKENLTQIRAKLQRGISRN